MLIYSLTVPNLLQLTVVVPLQYVELGICLFITRFIVMAYGVLGHLWAEGGFRSKWFIFSAILISFGNTVACWDTIHEKEFWSPLFWIGSGLVVFGVIILAMLSWFWLSVLRKSGFTNVVSSQISCTAYLLLFSMMLGSFVVLATIYRGTYGVMFLTLVTYFEAAFTLSLTMLQSRLSRHELTRRDVRTYAKN